jgi:hypothetical protein
MAGVASGWYSLRVTLRAHPVPAGRGPDVDPSQAGPLSETTRRRLLMQGFCASDVDNQPMTGRLARWTPLSCAAFGSAGLTAGLLPLGLTVCPCTLATLAGLWVGSGWFLLALGVLTLTGALTSRSIYDRLYNATLRHFLRTPPVPRHGAPRRFGCAVGGVMYVASGVGFLLGNAWLAIVPAAFMVVFATIAGLTQWCFASALYAWVFGRAQEPAVSCAS